jgi:homoserine O-acetyltransferase
MTSIAGQWQAGLAGLTLLAALGGAAQAHRPEQPPHQLYKMGDLELESGEAIKDFGISYVTHGKLNAKKSNAILMVTAGGGIPADVDFINSETTKFLDQVTEGGKKLD